MLRNAHKMTFMFQKTNVSKTVKSQNTLVLHYAMHFCCHRRSHPQVTDTQQTIEAVQVGDQPDTSISG